MVIASDGPFRLLRAPPIVLREIRPTGRIRDVGGTASTVLADFFEGRRLG
jgi:hypothetical protein